MDINTPPKIVMTSPKNYAVDVATNLVAITVGFNTDLDAKTVAANVRLQSKDGVAIPISVRYEFRTITVSVKQALSPNSTYQLLLYGDANLTDATATCIRSALQIPMQGNAVINFTTLKSQSLKAPVGSYPPDKVVVETVPAFNWDTVEGALRYDIELSKSNTLSPIHWASSGIAQAPVYPSVPLGDGIYYWRVRGIDKDQKVSDWSPVYSFNLDTLKEAPIVDEDTVEPEVGYDPLIEDDYVEYVDYFPKEHFSNVATNLKTVYFQVLGTVLASDVSIEMFGEHVMGDGNDHGQLTGVIEVLPQSDGTTIIAFTPDELQIP